MKLNEFSIIKDYFSHPPQHSASKLGVGDDAAISHFSGELDIISCVDTLCAGTHFSHDTPARCIGHKALAVNLSDIAAMGAKPIQALLALTTPRADEDWLKEFTAGFMALAREHHLDLIGGDLSQGPLSITVTLIGTIACDSSVLRSGATANQDIYVSGYLGEAACALAMQKNKNTDIPQALLAHLQTPTPRLELGQALTSMASSCIDISDGLIADLEKLLHASKLGATLYLDKLLLSSALLKACSLSPARDYALGGGDDYELCFCAEAKHRQNINALSKKLALPISRIGQTTADLGLTIKDHSGKNIEITQKGYRHFAE